MTTKKENPAGGRGLRGLAGWAQDYVITPLPMAVMAVALAVHAWRAFGGAA